MYNTVSYFCYKAVRRKVLGHGDDVGSSPTTMKVYGLVLVYLTVTWRFVGLARVMCCWEQMPRGDLIRWKIVGGLGWQVRFN